MNLDKLKKKTEQKLETIMPDIPEKDRSFQNKKVFWSYCFDYSLYNRSPFVTPVNPRVKNERLIAQQGLFMCLCEIEKTFEDNLSATFTYDEILNAIKLIIFPSTLTIRSEIIQDLSRMNVTMATLYPDLNGLAQSLMDFVHFDILDSRFIQELKNTVSEEPRL